jgi:pimeloyl-ACP methyl ester carboxylesterase
MEAARPGPLNQCEALAGMFSFAGTRLISAVRAPAGALSVGGVPVAEHCLVQGAMNERVGIDGLAYAIGFEMRLPRQWNGRFWYQANGGIDGSVVPAIGQLGGGPLTSALSQGFAVISSDAGHDNRVTRGPGFGLDPQARLDYGYNAVAALTPMAKALIAQAYGRPPDRSYIGGCSNGGRHAMVAAARHPEMFDGYLVGSPGYRLPLAAVANIFGAQQYKRVATDPKDLSTAFTQAERQTVVNAVLGKCDRLDGARDGMIQDTNACAAAFDLARDVPTCQGARDGSCLSAEQKAAIGPIFRGATTKNGKPFYASFPFDAGLASADVASWEFSAPLTRDSGAVGFIFATPPHDPKTFKAPDFVLESDVDAMLASVQARGGVYTESAMDFMTPPNDSDLSKLQARGARMLVYHGVSDAIFSVNDTEAWYRRVLQRSGEKTADHARFFRVPGMAHCRDGLSTDQFDAISPLVRWVEQGQAPERIDASARGAGNPGGVNKELPADWAPDRTRPLCPYPTVARYQGGDVEKASSFRCQ